MSSSSPESKSYHTALHIEKMESLQSQDKLSLRDEALTYFTPAEQKKIMHRIDRRLVLTVGALYCISLLDRTNLGAAAIAGMMSELRMDIGFRYSTVTLVFFTSYILFQPPATILTRKLGPKVFLSAITFFWGVIMLAMGFARDWRTLAGLRVILGLFEAGLFPGCVYLLSTWYVRYDMGKRYSIFYMIGCIATACGGIIAYGLMQMNGLANLAGWRWIFILEGILTCLLAGAAYVLLVPFPDENAHKAWKFLNQREVDYIVARVNADRADVATEPFSLVKFLRPAFDLKVWGLAVIFCPATTTTYALAYFLPIMLRNGMGFSIAASQCLVAPPYVFAAVMMFVTAWIGDKCRIRGPLLAFNATIAIIGLALIGWAKPLGVQYFGIFLTCAGANANIPQCMTFQANNIRGQWKRAFCSALLVGFAGVGGIAGSSVFRSQDSPQYLPGLYACIAANLMIITVVCILDMYFLWCNKRADRGEMMIEGTADDFRYTL